MDCIKFAGSSTAFVRVPLRQEGEEEIGHWLEREKRDTFLWGGQVSRFPLATTATSWELTRPVSVVCDLRMGRRQSQ